MDLDPLVPLGVRGDRRPPGPTHTERACAGNRLVLRVEERTARRPEVIRGAPRKRAAESNPSLRTLDHERAVARPTCATIRPDDASSNDRAPGGGVGKL